LVKNNNDDDDDDDEDNNKNSNFISASRKIAEEYPAANRGPLRNLKY